MTASLLQPGQSAHPGPRRARPARTLVARAARGCANLALATCERVLFPRRRPADARCVVVHRTGSLGDALTALPAIEALRRSYPRARLVVLTSTGGNDAPGLAALLANGPLGAEVRTYAPAEVASPSAALRLARELRSTNVDVFVELPQNGSHPARELRHALFARATGARFATGFRVGGLRWLSRTLARALADEPAPAQEAERLLALLARRGFETGTARFPLADDREARERAHAALAGCEGLPLLVVAPGAKRAAHRWPAERFASLARRWIDTGGAAVVLGGAGDRDAGACIGAAGALDLTGRTTLATSAEIVRRADAVACNDSGVAHLAAAVGARCVVLGSARDLVGRWRPHGAGHVVLRDDPACGPCWLEECPRENACLAALDEDAAWEALRSVTKNATSQPSASRRDEPTGTPGDPPGGPLPGPRTGGLPGVERGCQGPSASRR